MLADMRVLLVLPRETRSKKSRVGGNNFGRVFWWNRSYNTTHEAAYIPIRPTTIKYVFPDDKDGLYSNCLM